LIELQQAGGVVLEELPLEAVARGEGEGGLAVPNLLAVDRLRGGSRGDADHRQSKQPLAGWIARDALQAAGAKSFCRQGPSEAS
jgi:hypothetical protein